MAYDFDMSLVEETLFPKCTETAIVNVEKTIGAKLPDDYRLFLQQVNGVSFKGWPAFPLQDSSDGDDYGEVEAMYGIAPTPHADDVLENQSSYEFDKRVPGNIVAIGRNMYHEQLCISVEGSDRGTVYLWRPGVPFEEFGNTPTYEYLHPAARSFTEFWESLYPNPNPKLRGDG